MQTAKLFMNGNSQAVRLPKEYRFSGSEVGIKKVGSTVMIYPENSVWETFLSAPPMDDDVYESILEARREDREREQEIEARAALITDAFNDENALKNINKLIEDTAV